MSRRQRPIKTDVRPLPDEIDSPRAKLVFLYLLVGDGKTLCDLHDALGIKKITLLSILGLLENRGLIDRADEHYVPVN